jgi:maltose O-acetyltransferase
MFANICLFPSLRIALFRLSGIKIGKRAFINRGVVFVDNYRGGAIFIGNRAALAPGVTLLADSDPNYSNLNRVPSFIQRGQVTIGDDAWLGAGVIVLPNVIIGKSSVIGAGSVITQSVEDYAIMAGNPARKIGDIRNRLGTD